MEVSRIEGGYQYRASSHDNRLTLTRVGDRVRFADTAARVLRALPRGCRQAQADTGLAVSCRIPDGTTAATPLLLEIVPQLGDDTVDGSALGAELTLDMLAGAGDDDLRGGAGNDRFNGSGGADKVQAGPGVDFVRLGDGDDAATGGAGNDQLVGTAGNDKLSGGIGDDQLEGGDGDDLLLGGAGEDTLLCGAGVDTTDDDGDLDEPRHCELTVP